MYGESDASGVAKTLADQFRFPMLQRTIGRAPHDNRAKRQLQSWTNAPDPWGQHFAARAIPQGEMERFDPRQRPNASKRASHYPRYLNQAYRRQDNPSHRP